MPHAKGDKSQDSKTAKHIRGEFVKHLVECQNAEFRVMHGICYVSGSLGVMRGGAPDSKAQAHLVRGLIIAKREVKDVIFYCSFRSA